ncbi:protein-tyrosine-phosphatase [Tenacibaculum sp. SZ-18]|uniref:arsenate-mycothiol transferase ArsC n=1 Tax=Tenacibaculum sp. SZ-18 TaxID=754423 RepID=UPI000C2D2006|nr:protein-tyrosine-phosphatase [Tenacibaculum sp. SZ-18]AUC14465.1 protein-tyrosine-phosphatase [Tenacibaculum sp. SZ-18]
MNQRLEQTIKNISSLPISEERKEILKPLLSYLQKKRNNDESIRINYICTHNSRRSHLGQIWMQTLASHFNIDTITTYSGGTEATAMAKPIVETLKNQGFEIQQLSQEQNPVYAIKYDLESLPVIGFSKKYDNEFNPNSGFAAIMTCSEADGGCPFVAGSEIRVPITYEDPKISDNTDKQSEVYLTRSNQIASEMYYVLSQLN